MKRHGNPFYADWPSARAAAVAASKKAGGLWIAKKSGSGYEIVAAKRLKSNKKRTGGLFSKAAPKSRRARKKKFRRMVSHVAKAKSFPNRKKGPYRKWRDRSLVEKAFKAFQAGSRKRNRRAPARRPRPSPIRRRNPGESLGFIGWAPTLAVSGLGNMQFPRGRLFAGPDSRTVYLDLGGAKAPPAGSRVTRVDYDDPVKAVEAYKEIGRFRHDCQDPFVVGTVQGGKVALVSPSTAWKRE